MHRLALDDSVSIIAKRTNGDTLLVERASNVSVDRGSSGWGVPASDVYAFAANATRYDLSSSRSIIAEYMPGVGDDELQTLLLVGEGFRLLASADWASRDLTHAWPEKGMVSLRMYEQPMHAWGTTLAAAAQPA